MRSCKTEILRIVNGVKRMHSFFQIVFESTMLLKMSMIDTQKTRNLPLRILRGSVKITESWLISFYWVGTFD